MKSHPNKYIVHHIDGNKLNNAYSNLQIMNRRDHVSMHHIDPKFIEAEKTRNKKISAYFTDPVNITDIKARGKAISKSLIAYNTDPANAEAVEAMHGKQTETIRKNNGWIMPESDPEFFENSFTIEKYAERGKIGYDLAVYRLRSLIESGKSFVRKS